jgi:hypothetical protein
MSAGCASYQATPATVAPASTAPNNADTAGRVLVPTGYGTMRQDDLALHVTASGILIRVVPLDESVIRLLTPDSYRAMRDVQLNSRKEIDAISRRNGTTEVTVWFVSFYGIEPDARFTPLDLMVSSSGRDFRPLDVIPLTAGFGQQRLKQRETQNALYVYDGDIDLNQLIALTYQGIQDNSWDQTLKRIERERAMIRARASSAVTATQSR